MKMGFLKELFSLVCEIRKLLDFGLITWKEMSSTIIYDNLLLTGSTDESILSGREQ